MTDIQTTAGPVCASELGVVLPHEHLFINELREDRAGGLLNDADAMLSAVREFKNLGGHTLVELTTGELTAGASPDPLGLYGGGASSGYAEHGTRAMNNVLAIADLAAAADVNIILGTGQYRDPYLGDGGTDRRSVDQIAERITLDLTEGFPGTDIRAGLIGEVGADKWYVSALEERSIRAAGRAHCNTGATVSTHTSKWPVGGAVVDLLMAEDVSPDRIILGHCSTIDIPDYHLDMARRGVYLQFDTLRGGPERVVDRWVANILALVKAGYLERILLSHDVCLKSHLAENGGCGFTYILTDFLPRLHQAGLSEAETDLMIRDNARHALTGT